MEKSLQEIEDFYISQGLKGEALRAALDRDVEYQKLLKERKLKIRNKYGISEEDDKTFLLPTEEDYQILSMIKKLENLVLSEEDRKIIKLIKTQLLDEWRPPLIEELQTLLNKYS